MHLTSKEAWTALHGMLFGSGFLLLFSAGFLAIWSLRPDHFSDPGLKRHLRHLSAGACTMALLAWLTVLVGTYFSYPWYRAKAPALTGGIALQAYPKFYLLSNPKTAEWHEFAMEWKEHIAWFVPILLTAVAFIVTSHGKEMANNLRLRRVVLFLFSVALFSAAVAGALGALINKAAPIH